MKTEPNSPASPCKTFEDSGHALLDEVPVFHSGFTKREDIATRFMDALIRTQEYHENSDPEELAHDAVNYADALIKALNHNNQ